MNNLNLYKEFQYGKKENIIFELKGLISQDVLVGFVELIKDKMFFKTKKNLINRKIFSIFIELFQNIVKHSTNDNTRFCKKKGSGDGINILKTNKEQKQNKLPLHKKIISIIKRQLPTSEKFTTYLIMVMTFIAVVLLSNYLITETIETISKNEGKNIPIYCVYTGEDKKVAISFDAAWGNVW